MGGGIATTFYVAKSSDSAAIALRGSNNVAPLADGLSRARVQQGQLVLQTALALLWRDVSKSSSAARRRRVTCGDPAPAIRISSNAR